MSTTPPTSKKPTSASSAKRSYVPPNASRVLASTLGVLPGSMLVSALIARYLPVDPALAYAMAYALWLPIWIAAICWVARSRSAKRAWLFALSMTALAAALLFAIPH